MAGRKNAGGPWGRALQTEDRCMADVRGNPVWFAQGVAGRPGRLQQSKQGGRRGGGGHIIQGPLGRGRELGSYLEV